MTGTMGLPCDPDGYDLRITPCPKCGSRGCNHPERRSMPELRAIETKTRDLMNVLRKRDELLKRVEDLTIALRDIAVATKDATEEQRVVGSYSKKVLAIIRRVLK